MSLTSKIRSFQDMMETPVPPTRSWVGNGVLNMGTKMMVSSVAKSGKSFTVLQMAKDLTYGTHLFGHLGLPIEKNAKVFVVEQEVGEDSQHGRVKQVFHDIPPHLYDRLPWGISRPGIKIDTFAGRKDLEDLIDVVQPNILILDPISRLMGGNDSDNSEVKKLFETVDGLLAKYANLDLSIIMVHHASGKTENRMKPDRSFLNPYSMKGASMWVEAPDTMLTMVKETTLPGGWINRCRVTLRHGTEIPDFDLNILNMQPGAIFSPGDSTKI